jgi:hypothetical protein
MDQKQPAANVNYIATRALILAFLAVLWLPTIDSLFGLDHSPAPNENRRLAGFPEFVSLPKLGNYLAGLQHYFDDHFGFRKQLVRWNARWKLKLFDESPVSMAMEGRDGWLYWAGDGMIAHYRGAARFSQNDLSGWRALLESRRDWLARRGVKYIFVIAPDKQSIYPEFLPQWLTKSESPTKLDQFLAFMREHSSVPVLDLRPALLAAKKNGVTYLQTDTHWNNFGAFVACQTLIDALGNQIPSLRPLALGEFERKPIVQRGGDLAVCLQEEDQLQEAQQVSLAPRPPLAPLAQLGEVSNSTAPAATITRNPGGSGKAVVFRDSFGEAWIPFLGYDFHEVTYLRQAHWNKQVLLTQKPDVVIDEMVERLFNNYDPAQLMRADGALD